MSGRLTIVRTGLPLPAPAVDETVLGFEDFRTWIQRGTVFAHLGRHADGRLLVHRLEASGRPLPLALALRALSRGSVFIEDLRGRRRVLSSTQLARWTAQLVSEPFRAPALLRRVAHDLDRLERDLTRRRPFVLNLAASPVYLRSDLSFGVRAGGSVSHIAGVVNELGAFCGPPIMVTTDEVPTLGHAVEIHPVVPPETFWNFRELPTFVLNDACETAAERAIGDRVPAFVYQRYSPNNYSGIRIAHRHGVPFVLEYNGSEVWVARHWGRRLKHEGLTDRIERLNAAAADMIVVVSLPLADELAGRGIDRAKIVVNPNGVDPDRYRPDIDASSVRARHGLAGGPVIGFIGTFGRWHGAEVLARAFVALRAHPGLGPVRLLMIGDGVTMPDVRAILGEGGALDAAVFTGLVPQEQGPEHLAACDILVSPHVPNPDGTPFFGSPTKLFEYMATGRAIVASNLDQIGELLDHGRTAWLVPPADPTALATALRHLLDDPSLRVRLGAAARARVLERFTWREHTRRTIGALRERVPSGR